VRRPDGFRIIPRAGATADDFTIDAGITGAPDPEGLRNVGRIIVDGLDAIIQANLNFVDQPLHASHPVASVNAELARLGLPAGAGIAAVPSINGVVSVYLDVWERFVNYTEDASLVHAALGTESCVRRKREWVVRARVGTNAPQPGDADFLTGHSYYVLAHVTRSTADPVIRVSDILDRRERRLLTLPATLTEDVLGVGAIPYRRGEGRPAIDLRAAINALIRGDLPGLPERAIATAPGTDFMSRAFLFDGIGNIVAAWGSQRAGPDHVFASRMPLSAPTTGFTTALQITATTAGFRRPHAARTGPDRIFLAYETGLAAGANILYRHESFGNLQAAPGGELPVVDTAGVGETRPFVVVSGDFVVVFFHRNPPGWMYRRFRLSANAWEDPVTARPLAALGAMASNLHAAVDTAGNIWVAAEDVNTSNIVRLNPSTNAISQFFSTPIGPAGSTNETPFVVCPRAGGMAVDAWLFWRRNTGQIFAIANGGGLWRPAVQVIPASAALAREPAAVEDSEGTIWLFWTEGTGANGNIQLGRFSQVTSALSQSRTLIGSSDDDTTPFALIEPNDVIWLFWSKNSGGVNVDLFVKQVVTKV
jgi:hypothetical protein